MAKQYVMINDIIEQHEARMYNLRKYYPFFVLAGTSFAQYKEGRYAGLDMGYITMAVLRFFIEENHFNENEIDLAMCRNFIGDVLSRDFEIPVDEDDREDLITYIFDKLTNEGKSFEFSFYDPAKKCKTISRTRLIESRIKDGRVSYVITAEAIEFYLDTKEIKDESKINVEQVLLEKMITGENFAGGIDVVRRINGEVNKLIAEKDHIVDLLSYDVFAGAKRYEEYMENVGKWFAEEQKLFAKNKALVDKVVTKATYEKKSMRTLNEINELELLLKKTILKHGTLIKSTMELSDISDNIIGKAKLKKLRPIFDFERELTKMVKEDRPDKMFTILAPLFAPKIDKQFAISSIDNILTLRSEDEGKTTKEKRGDVDAGFLYEDEIAEERTKRSFAKLFYELAGLVASRGNITLREYNGLLEIKFGKEIYANADFYAYLTHLAGKSTYSIKQMLKKPDTILEEMVVSGMTLAAAAPEQYAPHLSLAEFGDLSFDVELDGRDEIAIGEDTFVTAMKFVRK